MFNQIFIKNRMCIHFMEEVIKEYYDVIKLSKFGYMHG